MARFTTVSMSRYNGGVAIKRAHGSSTVTIFDVCDATTGKWYPGIKAYGRTPGERHTFAIARVEAMIAAEATVTG